MVVVCVAARSCGQADALVLRRVLDEDSFLDFDVVFANSSLVTHSKWPAYQEDAGQGNLCRQLVPPGRDVLRTADEEGPFPVIFNVEVVVNAERKNNFFCCCKNVKFTVIFDGDTCIF